MSPMIRSVSILIRARSGACWARTAKGTAIRALVKARREMGLHDTVASLSVKPSGIIRYFPQIVAERVISSDAAVRYPAQPGERHRFHVNTSRKRVTEAGANR